MGRVGSGRLTFGVLGAVEVTRDGAGVPLPSARQRAVLAALLANAGRPVTGHALVAAAWDDELPRSPQAALHTLLSRLRAALGSGTIHRDAVGYRLAVAPDQVDAHRFEAYRARAAAAAPSEAVGLYDAALALWRGPAYAEFADREFATADSVRLDELRRVTVEDRAERALALGRSDAEVAGLAAFAAEHPLRERAGALLMTALHRSGRDGEALAYYQEHRLLLARELGLDPSPALRELHRTLLAGARPALPGHAPTGRRGTVRWSVADTPFVGRDTEMRTLLVATSRNRLVTVTGVGGVGKSRLVAEAASVLAERLGLVPTVVELARTDTGHAVASIAAALALGPSAGDPGEAALEYLGVTPTLLILDNCEHVRPALVPFADAVLRRCPDVAVLATSRRRLGIDGEQAVPIEPLATAPPGSPPGLSASAQLFADRMRRVRPAGGTPVAAVEEICRRLDGLPLAIELAATRAATLGVEPVRERLDQVLDLLGDAGRPGERSLRAALDWSHALLAEPERALFAALGVFEGDFDLDAAEQVGADVAPAGRASVAAGLAELVEASLVGTRAGDPQDGTVVRHRLLEVVRAFAREQLAGCGTEERVRTAHANWVREMVTAAADAVRGQSHGRAWSRLPAAADIRSAAVWALRTGRPELAGQITGRLVLASQHRPLPPDLLDVTRRVGEDPAVRTSAVGSLAGSAGAFTATIQGDLDAGERGARAALDAARTPDERFLALCALGIVTLYRGEHDRSRRWWSQLLAVEGLAPSLAADGHASLALLDCYGGRRGQSRRHAARAVAAAEGGSPGHRAFACYVAAEVAAAIDPAGAIPQLRSAARDAERVGAEFECGLADTALLAALTRLGHRSEALDIALPLLDRWLRLGTWPQLWTTVRIVAELLATLDDPATAALLLAAADHAPSAPAPSGGDVARYGELASALHERLTPSVREEVSATAEMLPRARVVERARLAAGAVLARS